MRKSKHLYVFMLPLHCAPPINSFLRMHWRDRSRLKHETLTRMMRNHSRRATPLPGKPRVRITRMSSVQPDHDSAWQKTIVDCLKRDGMGILRDDSPRDVEIETGWRPALPGEGMVLVEVFPGETA